MPEPTTCILVASESAAAIYDSRQGISHLRHVMRWPGAYGVSAVEARHLFALQLASDLNREVQSRLYDGIIILAAPRMLEAVQDWLSPEIRSLVIAAIAYPHVTRMKIPDESSCLSAERYLQ